MLLATERTLLKAGVQNGLQLTHLCHLMKTKIHELQYILNTLSPAERAVLLAIARALLNAGIQDEVMRQFILEA